MRQRTVATMLGAVLGLGTARAATFTVTTTADSGAGSLRQAILDANADAAADTIAFAIPGAGVHTIALAAALPAVVNPVTIDGTTQPGYAGTPVVQIDGNATGNTSSGITLDGHTGSTVVGLAIGRFQGDGNADGAGVFINNGGGHVVAGNYLGTDAAGALARRNQIGVLCIDSTGNTIGGTTAAARNVISANSNYGVEISGGGQTVVEGNYVGTTAAGTARLANGDDGVFLTNSPTNVTIGGTAAGAGNVVSGNGAVGILANGSGHVIQGNRIGTDAAGTHSIGNTNYGIFLAGATTVTIGGTTAGAANLVSANAAGIYVNGGSGVVIQGNRVGTDAGGTADLGNSAVGVLVGNGATTIAVGGPAAGQGNVIAYSGGAGVAVQNGATAGVAIRGNSIFGNVGLGIDLSADGVTANDTNDGDGGPNGLQNFPTLSTAIVGGGATAVGGQLKSAKSVGFTIDFYADVAPDPSAHGQGRTYLGSTTVTTDANGTAAIAASLAALAAGNAVTATATDAAGNTSEFGQDAIVGGVPTTTTTTTAPASTTTTAPGGGPTTTSTTTTTLPNCPTADLDGVACVLAAVPPPSCDGQSIPSHVKRLVAAARAQTTRAQAKGVSLDRRTVAKLVKTLTRAVAAVGKARKLAADCAAGLGAELGAARDRAAAIVPSL